MFGLGFRGALGKPCESSCDQSYYPAKRIKFIVTQDATNAQCKANATGFGWWLGVQHGHAVAKVIKHQTHQRHKQQLTQAHRIARIAVAACNDAWTPASNGMSASRIGSHTLCESHEHVKACAQAASQVDYATMNIAGFAATGTHYLVPTVSRSHTAPDIAHKSNCVSWRIKCYDMYCASMSDSTLALSVWIFSCR